MQVERERKTRKDSAGRFIRNDFSFFGFRNKIMKNKCEIFLIYSKAKSFHVLLNIKMFIFFIMGM